MMLHQLLFINSACRIVNISKFVSKLTTIVFEVTALLLLQKYKRDERRPYEINQLREIIHCKQAVNCHMLRSMKSEYTNVGEIGHRQLQCFWHSSIYASIYAVARIADHHHSRLSVISDCC